VASDSSQKQSSVNKSSMKIVIASNINYLKILKYPGIPGSVDSVYCQDLMVSWPSQNSISSFLGGGGGVSVTCWQNA
jgi:hypothetical protein